MVIFIVHIFISILIEMLLQLKTEDELRPTTLKILLAKETISFLRNVG